MKGNGKQDNLDVWGESRQKRIPRKWTWEVYGIALIITIILFMSGASVSLLFTNTVLTPVEKQLSSLNDDVITLEMVLSSANRDDFCTLYPIIASNLEAQTWQIGEQLEYLEESKKSFDPRTKYKYFHLEFRDMLLLKKAKELCNISVPYILYIYSNEEGECPKCPDEGLALWKARKRLNNSIRIYSFDGSMLDDPIVRALKLKYNYSTYPTLIINGKGMIEGYADERIILQAINASVGG